jgi:hypothetical protein
MSEEEVRAGVLKRVKSGELKQVEAEVGAASAQRCANSRSYGAGVLSNRNATRASIPNHSGIGVLDVRSMVRSTYPHDRAMAAVQAVADRTTAEQW